jgi:hypothetical protein
MQSLKEIEVQLNAAPDGQVSLTDPDARSMKTRGTGVVGYNVQTAVDTKHHLIVAHVVGTQGRNECYDIRTACCKADLPDVLCRRAKWRDSQSAFPVR